MNYDYQAIQEYMLQVLKADGFSTFRADNSYERQVDALVRASDADLSISIVGVWFPKSDDPQLNPDFYDQMESQTPFSSFAKGSPSGLPLGSHSRYKLSTKREGGLGDIITLYARSATVRVIIQLRPNGDRKYLGEKDLARAEKIARLVFGEMSEKGAPTFSLKQAALAQGWQSLTKQNGTILLSRGNQQILIPIGGKKVKIGKNWVTLGGYFSVDRAPEGFRPYLARRS